MVSNDNYPSDNYSSTNSRFTFDQSSFLIFIFKAPSQNSKICLPINLNIYNIYKTSCLIRSEMFKGDKNVAIGQFINLLHGYVKLNIS